MKTLAGAAGAIVIAVVLLCGCTATSPGATAPATSEPAAASTPTVSAPSTTTQVEWQDAEALIILPSANTPDTLHGPSWVTEGGHLSCGIYDDAPAYDKAGNDLGGKVFYGCRVDSVATTFTYPDFDNPGRGIIGGCPSGFSAFAGQVPSPLCNSGQVFSSETDHSNVLKTGQGVRFAGIECVAIDVDAIRCTETATSHGFQVSLSDYALF